VPPHWIGIRGGVHGLRCAVVSAQRSFAFAVPAAAAAAFDAPKVPASCGLHIAAACRGGLSAGQRRIAYDSLGVYQQLHQAALEPLSPESWSQTARYSKTISTILAADGVRWAGGRAALLEQSWAQPDRVVRLQCILHCSE